MAKELDLGCGNRKRPGTTGLDINPAADADIVHDLNRFPYPFDDSTFDTIYADNVLEHLDDVIRVMEELQRICKPGGLIKVFVPYFRARWAFIDPTHRHYFTVDSFSYFDPEHIHNRLYRYSEATFKVEAVVFNERIDRGILAGAVKRLANRWPRGYETYLSHFLPLDELTIELRTLK